MVVSFRRREFTVETLFRGFLRWQYTLVTLQKMTLGTADATVGGAPGDRFVADHGGRVPAHSASDSGAFQRWTCLVLDLLVSYMTHVTFYGHTMVTNLLPFVRSVLQFRDPRYTFDVFHSGFFWVRIEGRRG